MDFTLISVLLLSAVNLYLFLSGEMIDVVAVSSCAFIIGLLDGRIIAKLEAYEDELYDQYADEFYEDDNE